MSIFKRHLVGWMLTSAIVAGLLVMVANSAIWANRYLFNTQRFTDTAATAITSESSRRAVATEITDRALADYPRLKNLIDDAAVNFISGLLGTQPAQKLTTKAVERLQVTLTSPPREEPVVINLTELKDRLNQLIEVSGRQDETKVDPAKIPDQIVLLEPRNLPNFYQAGVTLGWLSPLLILVSIALLAWPYFVRGARYLRIVTVQGAILVVISFIALALGPLFRPTVLGNVDSANLRVVVGNLYDAFINAFNAQTLLITSLGALAMLASLSIYSYRYYRSTTKLSQRKR